LARIDWRTPWSPSPSFAAFRRRFSARSPLYDRAFETFEADLDRLETTGVLVERFDRTAVSEVSKRPVVQQLLAAEGDQWLGQGRERSAA